ncbi:MAG: hypothetical protein LBN09_03535 [Clostridioides sp.]|nr:hypothetical protein [Clostridioides sp.]
MRKIFKPIVAVSAVIAMSFSTSNIGLVSVHGNALTTKDKRNSYVSGGTQEANKDLSNKADNLRRDDDRAAELGEPHSKADKSKPVTIALSLDQISISDEFYISIKSTEQTDKLLKDTIHIKIPDNIEFLKEKTDQENNDITTTYDDTSRNLIISYNKPEVQPEDIRLFLKANSEGSNVVSLLTTEEEVISNDIQLNVGKPVPEQGGIPDNIPAGEKVIDLQGNTEVQNGTDVSDSIRQVSTWDEFKDAYSNEDVEEIQLKSDIQATGANEFQGRKNDIKIIGIKEDGSHSKLMFPKSYSVSGKADLPLVSLLRGHLKHFELSKVEVISDGAWSVEDVDSDKSNISLIGSNTSELLSGWNFDLRDISTDSDKMIPRLVSCTGKVVFSGKLELTTICSAVEAANIVISEGADYTGGAANEESPAVELTESQKMPLLRASNDLEKKITIEKNGSYTPNGPQIINTGTVTVEEGAQLNIKQSKATTEPALTMNNGTKLETKNGSKVILESSYGSALYLNGDNIKFNIGEGGTFKASGSTGPNDGVGNGEDKNDTSDDFNPGVIALSGKNGCSSTEINLYKPALYDIVNKGGGDWICKTTGSVNSSINITTKNTSIWDRGSDINAFTIHTTHTDRINESGTYFTVKITGTSMCTDKYYHNTGISHKDLEVDSDAPDPTIPAMMKGNYVVRFSSFSDSTDTLPLTFTVPNNIDFGTVQYSISKPISKRVPEHYDKNLIITDPNTKKVKWSLSVRMKEPLKNDFKEYINREDVNDTGIAYMTDGKPEKILTTESLQILKDITNTSDANNITDTWGPKTGLCLEYDGPSMRKTAYSGVIEWTLSNVPSTKP